MKQKTTPALILLLLLSLSGFTQTFDWGFNLGGHTDEYPRDIHKVPGGIILNSSMNGLRKYDEAVNLVWKFSHFDHVHDGAGITSSDVDEMGNIYVGLYINNWPDYVAEIGGFTFQGSLNLVKIDPQGNILWSRKIGGSNERVKYHNRKVYLMGNFRERININNEIELESRYECPAGYFPFGTHLFLARFSDIGVLEKAVKYGKSDDGYASSMEVDEEGNIFLAGIQKGSSCVDHLSYLLRFDKDLNLVWEKKVTSRQNEEFVYSPLNLFLSENGRLYLVNSGIGEINNEEFSIPNTTGEWTFNLMEYDAATGDFMRINSYAKGTWNENFVPPSPLLNNLHLQEYKDHLLVFTSSNSPLSFVNREFVPQERQENLLLFRVSKKDFTSEYLTHFEATIPEFEHYVATDNPGQTLVVGNKLYITASFQSSPLKMFGVEIPNNSGNNDRDILLAKLDISGLAKPENDKDDDRDGVINFKDYCPNTPVGTAVDFRGCSALQNDLDSDGVINRRDNCPDTPPGAVVNEKGCEILILPVDNFKILSTSETCYGAGNAIIHIESEDTSHQFYANISGRSTLIPFTSVLEIAGLGAGAYRLCITAEGFPEYQNCFYLIIEQPENLDVFSMVNNDKTMVDLELKGGEQYFIIHNDVTYLTSQDQISLPLVKGLNKIRVGTEKECQGIFEEVIVAGYGMLLYPNPVEEKFTLDFKNVEDTPQNLEILGAAGNVIKRVTIGANVKSETVEVAYLPPGTYFVRVFFNSGVETVKILKK